LLKEWLVAGGWWLVARQKLKAFISNSNNLESGTQKSRAKVAPDH
jgi:hypothetical protein